MQASTLRPAQPMLSRTFAAVIEHRPYGEYWGDTRHTVTLTATAQGIAAQVNGQDVPTAEALGILSRADRVEVIEETPMPAPTIGKARAARLHRLMARYGVPSGEHYGFAGAALDRPVFSLAALTEPEARAVWQFLQATHSAAAA
ncbi:hypothetical protein [Deinococcus sp. RL]|uniref:hypothetical protein n=1 Tax=Deinococcus sp. RL TaxID=1489678 RepID=UPI00054F8C3C|nr:hypothetical protein [Deinococcus sp. RL]